MDKVPKHVGEFVKEVVKGVCWIQTKEYRGWQAAVGYEQEWNNANMRSGQQDKKVGEKAIGNWNGKICVMI